jgi:concanavalin A-like lectin/glucanase superfamily protein/VanZ like protein
MNLASSRIGGVVGLRLPVIVLVLALTAIPMKWRSLQLGIDDLHRINVEAADVVSNVILYIPIGVVLAARSAWPTVIAAGVLSGFAEGTQLVTDGRSPSIVDVAMNVLGAWVGWLVITHWKTLRPRLVVTRRRAAIAGLAAAAYVGLAAPFTPDDVEEAIASVVAVTRTSRLPMSDHGSTAPGGLEARWTFDDRNATSITDVEHGLTGRLVNGPTFQDGIDGAALVVDGRRQYVDLGTPVSLRLTGSMTITAWIKQRPIGIGDGSILSTRGRLGYQLSTSVDHGQRTLAMKMANASGGTMSRYGATPIVSGSWYHVAGVYDAEARSIDVYVNGQLDDGCVQGPITSSQQPSWVGAAIGIGTSHRRAAFPGAIDDLRIYSRALSEEEISAEYASARKVVPLDDAAGEGHSRRDRVDVACPPLNAPDARMSGVVVAFGMLVGLACVGVWPSRRHLAMCLVVSCLAGITAALRMPSMLPGFYRLVVPLLTLVGSASVVASHRAAQMSANVDDPS